MTFISEHGLVRYMPHLGLKKLHEGKPCEGCARPAAGLDHCHDHGWVRGVLCSKCNHSMGLIDARQPGPHWQALLDYWPNCPDCAAAGPWEAAALLPARPPRGSKFSVYLPDDVYAAWKATGLPLSELIRRGLEAGEPAAPVDVATLRRVLSEVLRSELRSTLGA